MGSQRWGGCQLPFLYCCSTSFYSPVAFKGRRALNYTMSCIYPFIPSDQVSEKKMMWKIFKENPSFQETYCFRLLTWSGSETCTFITVCTTYSVWSQVVQKKILFACEKCTKIPGLFVFLRQYFSYVLLQEEKKKKKKKALLWVTNLSCNCRIIIIIGPKPKILLLRS